MKEKILNVIENNAKISSSDIAKILKVDENDVIACLGEMETEHIICGYKTIINWDKISEEKVNALIEVKAIPQKGTGFDQIAQKISKFDEVDSVYLISGGYDFLLQIQGKSMKEVSFFVFNKLSTLDQIQSTGTHFVLKKYKDHGIKIEKLKNDKRVSIVI